MISPVKHMEMASEWLHLVVSCSQMNVAAAEVIARRTVRLLQCKMTLAEAVEIVAEKPLVVAISWKESAIATVRGGDPVQIAHAAIKPIKARTLSNLKALRAG